MLEEILKALEQPLTPKQIGTLALYAVVTGLLSLLLARRSQVDAWAERRPRIAGLLKIMRGLGLDPWILFQGICLVLFRRLPLPPVVELPRPKITALPRDLVADRHDTDPAPPPSEGGSA